MTVRVIRGTRALVAGLVWQTLSSAQKPSAQAAAIARTLKAQRIWAPSNARTAGFVPRADAAGVKLPRRAWPAAAMFATLSDVPRTALLALEIPVTGGGQAREAALIAVQDGAPLPDYDLIVPIDEVAREAERALSNLERVVGERPAPFGELLLGGAPISWDDIAQRGVAPALSMGSTWTPVVLAIAGVALLLGGYEGYDRWQAEQRRQAQIEAARKKIDPNATYRESVGRALKSTPWLGPKELQQLVALMGRMPTTVAGFQVDAQSGIECNARFECSATYRRGAGTPATYNDFARLVPNGLFNKVVFGVDGQSVAVSFGVAPAPSAPAPGMDALLPEADLPRRVWPILQQIDSLPATSKLAVGTTVVGTIPQGSTEGELTALVRAWPLEISLPAWAAEASPALPGLAWDKVVLKLQPQPTLYLTGRLHAVRK